MKLGAPNCGRHSRRVSHEPLSRDEQSFPETGFGGCKTVPVRKNKLAWRQVCDDVSGPNARWQADGSGGMLLSYDGHSSLNIGFIPKPFLPPQTSATHLTPPNILRSSNNKHLPQHIPQTRISHHAFHRKVSISSFQEPSYTFPEAVELTHGAAISSRSSSPSSSHLLVCSSSVAAAPTC